MRYQICCIVIAIISSLQLPARAETVIELSCSPAHIHNTADDRLSGFLGAGLGITVDQKLSFAMSWEFNSSPILTMEPPMADTNRSVDIISIEVARDYCIPRWDSIYIRAGINAGIGFEETWYYEDMDSSEIYKESSSLRRYTGNDTARRSMVGILIGLAYDFQALAEGLWMEIDYRPKLYGAGDKMVLVHSGALTFRIGLLSL